MFNFSLICHKNVFQLWTWIQCAQYLCFCDFVIRNVFINTASGGSIYSVGTFWMLVFWFTISEFYIFDFDDHSMKRASQIVFWNALIAVTNAVGRGVDAYVCILKIVHEHLIWHKLYSMKTNSNLLQWLSCCETVPTIDISLKKKANKSKQHSHKIRNSRIN